MEKIASRKARNESVQFYNQTTLQTFFFIGNSVHGSLPLTFDTHPTTLKEKATIRRKITTIQGFLFIGENSMVTHLEKNQIV